MPVKTASERFVQVCTQFEVTASDGVVEIVAVGDDSVMTLSSSIIEANTPNASIGTYSDGDKGFINLSTVSNSTDSSIFLSASTKDSYSRCEVKPNDISLIQGLAPVLGMIQMAGSTTTISRGVDIVGSSITLDPTSITLKVGPLTSLTLTADGIVLASGATKMALSVSGINEELGPITRSLSPIGHNLAAAESAMDVTLAGVNAKGPTSSFAFNATGQLSAIVFTKSADAIMNQKAALASVNG